MLQTAQAEKESRAKQGLQPRHKLPRDLSRKGTVIPVYLSKWTDLFVMLQHTISDPSPVPPLAQWLYDDDRSTNAGAPPPPFGVGDNVSIHDR